MKKSTLKRIAALSVAGLMATTALAGCGNTSSTTDGSSSKTDDAAKGSVYWLNFKPESDVALQDIAKMYKEKTGVDVKVVTAAAGTYNDTLTSEMDKDGAPTLFVVGNQASVETWGDYFKEMASTRAFLMNAMYEKANSEEAKELGFELTEETKQAIIKNAPLIFQNRYALYSRLRSSFMSPDWFMKFIPLSIPL